MKRAYKQFLLTLAEELDMVDSPLEEIEARISKEDIWTKAQSQVWELINDEFQKDMDDLFNGKSTTVGGRAQLVAYIGSLKSFFKHKSLNYHKKLFK